MPTEKDPALGEAIRQLRAERSLTQEDLAHLAGMTVANVSRIERADNNPTWATIRALAAACGVSVAELAERADQLRG